jgi:hypothetical protein
VWYVAGINGSSEVKTVNLDLSFISETPVNYTSFSDSNVENDMIANDIFNGATNTLVKKKYA